MKAKANQRGSWQRTEITPILPIAGQKFSVILRGIFGIVRGIPKLFIHSFLARFLAKPVMILGGNLAGVHCVIQCIVKKCWNNY